MSSTINGRVSHWFAELPVPRAALPGDRDADVCIVGAGYTGLWTAYYLKRADPSLRITVLEARFAGFGASGRNGGWLSGLAPGHRARLAEQHGRQPVIDWQRALNDAVDEVIAVAAARASTPTSSRAAPWTIARNEPQVQRLRAEVDEDRSWGDRRYPDAVERSKQPNGSTSTACCWRAFTPHCARVQPAKLVRGLADVVERLGVTIYEQTPVTDIAAGRAVDGARHGARPDHPACHRRLHHHPARSQATLAADEQRDDRHRPAARRCVGVDRLGRAAKLSAIPRTGSSTPSAPPMTASRSAAGRCRTGTARVSTATARSATTPSTT